MGFKTYYIIVKSPKLTNIKEILNKLQLEQYKPLKGLVPLSESNKPTTLFTGFFNDNFILVHEDLTLDFFNERETTDTEKLFIKTFPNCEIAVILENSTCELYGYTIIENGTKIRIKNGCNPEVFIDKGELLPEEREVLSQKVLEDDELEEMKENGMTEEQIEQFKQHLLSLKAQDLLTKRYFGEKLSCINTNQILLTMYELEKREIELKNRFKITKILIIIFSILFACILVSLMIYHIL